MSIMFNHIYIYIYIYIYVPWILSECAGSFPHNKDNDNNNK